MKKVLLLAALLSVSAAGSAKTCDEVKAEVDAKIKANGVANYSLEILEATASTDGKTVGTCDAGSKKIVYKRGIDRVRR
jgi:hypothetical protein